MFVCIQVYPAHGPYEELTVRGRSPTILGPSKRVSHEFTVCAHRWLTFGPQPSIDDLPYPVNSLRARLSAGTSFPQQADQEYEAGPISQQESGKRLAVGRLVSGETPIVRGSSRE